MSDTEVEITPEIHAQGGATSDGHKRSRVSAGRSVLPKIDGRTWEARRYRDVLDALTTQYDIDNEADLTLAKRVAGQTVFAEGEEAKQARGESYDTERLGR